MISVLALALFNSSLRPVELVDLSTRIIISAVTDHERTFIVSTTNIRSSEYYLFDHQSEACFEFSDGRIQTTLDVMVPTEQGYAIVDHFELLAHHLTKDGEFVRLDRILGFAGAPEGDVRVVRAFSTAPDTLLVTYYLLDGADLYLATVNLAEQRFEVRMVKPKSHEKVFWLELAGGLYRASNSSRRIEKLDPATHETVRVISPGVSERVPNPRWSPAFARYAEKYRSLMFNHLQLSDRAIWEVVSWEDNKISERLLYQLKGDRFTELEDKRFPVGVAAGTALWFDMDDGSYFLRGVP